MVEVARVTGGEKIDVVSDSGEEDIQVHANGLTDFADLTMQIARRLDSSTNVQRLGQKAVQRKKTGTVTREQNGGDIDWVR